jgi:two-component system LytT family response regulator
MPQRSSAMPIKQLTHFFIRHEGKHVRINATEICYIEARKNYSRIVTVSGVYFTLVPLKRFEALLPSADFQRIHRAFLIALSWMKAFDLRHVYGQGETLPIGETYRQVLLDSVTVLRDERKNPVAELH